MQANDTAGSDVGKVGRAGGSWIWFVYVIEQSRLCQSIAVDVHDELDRSGWWIIYRRQEVEVVCHVDIIAEVRADRRENLAK